MGSEMCIRDRPPPFRLPQVYEGGKIDRFPDGGKMSQYLASLKLGDKVTISGPWGMNEYKVTPPLLKGAAAFERRRAARAGRADRTSAGQELPLGPALGHASRRLKSGAPARAPLGARGRADAACRRSPVQRPPVLHDDDGAGGRGVTLRACMARLRGAGASRNGGTRGAVHAWRAVRAFEGATHARSITRRGEGKGEGLGFPRGPREPHERHAARATAARRNGPGPGTVRVPGRSGSRDGPGPGTVRVP